MTGLASRGFRPSPLSSSFAHVAVAAGQGRFRYRMRPDRQRATRAHSSIGQSPRLITGLFLVRTQVGPLASCAVPAATLRRGAEATGSRREPKRAPGRVLVADDTSLRYVEVDTPSSSSSLWRVTH